MRHKFRVVTVKKQLKSVHIYRSYRQNKPGGAFFRTPGIRPCGKQYNVDHAMFCLKGGFIQHRHDDMRDTLAKLLDETCIDVLIEPHLTPLTGEQLPTSFAPISQM